MKTLKPKARAIDTTALISGLTTHRFQSGEVCDLAQRRQQFPFNTQHQLLPAIQEKYTGCRASQTPLEPNTSQHILSKARHPEYLLGPCQSQISRSQQRSRYNFSDERQDPSRIERIQSFSPETQP